MAKLYDLARMTTPTVGTGTITLGSAVSGYLAFSTAGAADGDVLSYAILDGANSECGRGTYTASGTTLSRGPLFSTNGNAAISLSGNAQVFITALAEDVGPPTGSLFPWAGAGLAAPTGYLLADGSAVSRSTYNALFATIVPSLGTVTITIASPSVFTGPSLLNGDPVYLTTTGALPTGFSPNTIYYATAVAATFSLSATQGGAAINGTGSQSGVHSIRRCPFGLGDGSTTFNVPDTRGRTIAGCDINNATSRLTKAQTGGVSAANFGNVGGEQGHVLLTTELASHNHGYTDPGHSHVTNAFTQVDPNANWTAAGGNGLGAATVNAGTIGITILAAGANGPHNTAMPTLVSGYIIKT